MDFAIAGFQMRNNAVSVCAMGIERSAAAETKLSKSLLTLATHKLARHLR